MHWHQPHVWSEITRAGRTSREMRFEARKIIAAGDGSSARLLDRLEQRDLRLFGNPDERVDPPLPRHALELVTTALLEPEARPRFGVHDGARHEDFAGSRDRRDARSDVYGQAADIPHLVLDLPHVEAAPDLEAELADRVPDRVGAGERAGGAVEDDEESVARRLHLAAGEPLEPAPDDGVMAVEEGVPRLVAHTRSALRRADDVGEEDRCERALDGHRVSLAGGFGVPVAGTWNEGNGPPAPWTILRVPAHCYQGVSAIPSPAFSARAHVKSQSLRRLT